MSYIDTVSIFADMGPFGQDQEVIVEFEYEPADPHTNACEEIWPLSATWTFNGVTVKTEDPSFSIIEKVFLMEKVAEQYQQRIQDRFYDQADYAYDAYRESQLYAERD